LPYFAGRVFQQAPKSLQLGFGNHTILGCDQGVAVQKKLLILLKVQTFIYVSPARIYYPDSIRNITSM
jgi:hypothetical protein